MGIVGKLHQLENGAYAFFCTACRCNHWFGPPTWTFNGDCEKPTVIPSIISGDCHLTLTDGIIYYHADSKHTYAGRSIPLEDI